MQCVLRKLFVGRRVRECFVVCQLSKLSAIVAVIYINTRSRRIACEAVQELPTMKRQPEVVRTKMIEPWIWNCVVAIAVSVNVFPVHI